MNQPKRKPWVCAENQCRNCQTWTPGIEVPESCSFGILHALDLRPTGMQDKPRRWGKTAALIEVIISHLEDDCDVAIVCPTRNVRELLISRMRSHPAMARLLKTHSKQFLPLAIEEVEKGRLKNHHGVSLFTEEVTPEEFEKLKPMLGGNEVILGYYTSRG